ncbi:Imm49 family immunity protein [Streptomyces sp. V1I1]|uniref:Imm49 family immunity protein n=1 Tax=Streptomyces sp. V1I1 TaxID=3042272 RepID=UPI0027842C54|nr:Imm49 family immunity protein [Streptomyces sp. V1I1]MDQ0941964.1 hypothetical protein [Streptomyces sp. V1I1]
MPDGTLHLPDGAEIPKGAVDLGDGMVKLPEGTPAPAGSMPLMDAGSWTTAFWLAVVCRDKERMTALARRFRSRLQRLRLYRVRSAIPEAARRP